MGNKELIEKIEEFAGKQVQIYEKWNEELKDDKKFFKEAIATLSESSELFKSEKKDFLNRLLPWSPLILLVVIFLFTILFQLVANCGSTFTKGDITIIKTCPNEKANSEE